MRYPQLLASSGLFRFRCLRNKTATGNFPSSVAHVMVYRVDEMKWNAVIQVLLQFNFNIISYSRWLDYCLLLFPDGCHKTLTGPYRGSALVKTIRRYADGLILTTRCLIAKIYRNEELKRKRRVTNGVLEYSTWILVKLPIPAYIVICDQRGFFLTLVKQRPLNVPSGLDEIVFFHDFR